MSFSIGRKIYLGISKAEIDTLLRRLDEFHKSIKPDSIQRKTAVKEWKASTLITPKETIAWDRSAHIQGVPEGTLGEYHKGQINTSDSL